jgi:acyl-CoA thioesterase-2
MDGEDGLALLRARVGVEVLDDGRARGRTGTGGVERGGVFGGQMAAQALSACVHTAPPGSVPDSIHVNLLGASRDGVPMEYEVTRVRDGRALQHRDVRGYQDGAVIVQASVVSSMPSDGIDWQESAMPDVGPPDTGSSSRPWVSNLSVGLFEVAHPVGADDGRPVAHPLWIRSLVDVHDDPWLEAAVRAYWSDFGMNGATRFKHEEVGGPVSSVSATHSVWFHRHTPVRGWHLFDVHPVSLAGNQGFARSALFSADGALAATIGQGVFIRRPQV